MASKNILIVDDDPAVNLVLRQMVESLGHKVDTAPDGEAALEKMNPGTDLVMLDCVMPGMDGFTTAKEIRKREGGGDVPILMVTGHSQDQDWNRALEAGVNDFIEKPVTLAHLKIRTESLLKVKEAQDVLKAKSAELEEEVRRRTRHLEEASAKLARAEGRAAQMAMDTVHCLALTAEFRDVHTGGHIHRIGAYCAILAQAIGLDEEDVKTAYLSTTLHDVGKICIPDSVLMKPDRLDESETAIMRKHCVIGGRILSGFDSPILQAGKEVALYHHEKWNGHGYPEGLSGEAIPLFARICAVADVFDALTNVRPYKEAFSNIKAYGILTAESGVSFDPKIIDAFFQNLEEIEAVQKRYRQTNHVHAFV
ncbi:MAG: response regulator [Deltaproteobacteria bacterium]|nr:response regulator [Deltaproteobacteria bacterium]